MGMSINGSYFQRLSLCESLSRTLDVYMKGYNVFFPLVLLIVGIESVLWMILLVVLMPVLGLDGTRLENDPEYIVAHYKSLLTFLSFGMLVCVLIESVGAGAFVRAVSDIYLQREPSLGTCIQVGIRNASTMMLTAYFLGFVGIMLGCLLLFFPGIYLMVRWFLVGPIIVVEGLGAAGALKRSWALVSGSWCYVFATYQIAFSFVLVLQFTFKSVFPYSLYTPAGAVIGFIPAIIFGPILAIMKTIMYLNLRVEKEGLNAEVFDRNLKESNGGKSRASDYSTLMNEDDFGDLKQPIISIV
jgi:hypothetical protein